MTADGVKAAQAVKLAHSETPELGSASDWPRDDRTLTAWTDHYFNRTKAAVGRFGDQKVTYALFMRRPVVSAPRPSSRPMRR